MTIVGVAGNVQQAAGWGSNTQPVWETPTVHVPATHLRFSGVERHGLGPEWWPRSSCWGLPPFTRWEIMLTSFAAGHPAV